jgi:hypothetical protein
LDYFFVHHSTALNANIFTGPVLSEFNEGVKREMCDPVSSKIQKFSFKLPKEVTTGTVSTLIVLLQSGVRLEDVLVTLGMLRYAIVWYLYLTDRIN